DLVGEDVIPSDADPYAGSYSMVVTGSDVVNAVDDAGATTYGSAGVGFTFNDNCPYDASAYTGISFWAKGVGTIQFSLATADTVPVEDDGGACASSCYDNFAAPSITLTDTWTEYTYTWDQLKQGGWGAKATLDPAAISKVQWQVSGGGTDEGMPFTINLDSISFTPRGDEPEPNPTTGGDTDGETDGDTDGADTDDGVDTDDVADTDTDGAGA